MSVTINATQAGFHLLTKTGNQFSPNLFLRDVLNPKGRVENIENSHNWVSTTPGLGGLLMEYQSDSIFTPAQIGTESTIKFSSASLFRYENGEKILIANYHFDDPIEVEATYDVLKGGQTGWHANTANILTDMIKTQGIHFKGSKGVDVISPTYEPLYYTETNILSLRGGDDIATGTKGNDKIYGGQGDDIIFDNYGTNFVHGGKGNDIINLGQYSLNSIARGGKGDDQIWSKHGHDTLIGGNGDDQIYAGSGNDILRGGTGNDILMGDEGNDRIIGGKGDDWIYAGGGSDKLSGGIGFDHFVFYQNKDDKNIITDFESGIDHIHLLDFVGIYEDLQITQKGQHVWIRIAEKNLEIKIKNIDIAEISVDDFIFA